jgi:signal transduction histidine kinase
VAPENRARLFCRYARGEEAEPGVGGLGLSVVAWVVERHGGQVSLLDSSSGAAFQIILPSVGLPNRVSAAHETEPMNAGG